MFCKNGREIKAAYCYSGYGLFAFNEEATEACQISQEFAKSLEDAELLPYNNQKAPLNLKCNRNGSCFL